MASADKIAAQNQMKDLKDSGMSDEQIQKFMAAQEKRDQIKALDGVVGKLVNRMREAPDNTTAAGNFCNAFNEYSAAAGSNLRLSWAIDGTPAATTGTAPASKPAGGKGK